MYKIKVFEIDFGKEEVVLNIEDAKTLGIRAQDRVKLWNEKGTTIAVVNTTKGFISRGEVGIFSENRGKIKLKDGDNVNLEPVDTPTSIGAIKKKLHGGKLTKDEIYTIINESVDKSLSLIDLTAFTCGLEVHGMEMDEIEYLTKAMSESGEKLEIGGTIYDKHSLGGVPGDKTTLLVVPIIAAAGLTIPKTSSRAITDPAGTADRMEVFAPVSLSMEQIKEVVAKTNGCIVWGGAVDLAPADDILIQVEYPLSIDPRPLLLASVMSKKYSAGADYMVIDMPMGPETKVKDYPTARKLANDFIELSKRLGIEMKCAITYGAQPVGHAMGPALEAIEALETMQGKPNGSLLEKVNAISGMLLEIGGVAAKNKGEEVSEEYIKSGKALNKFKEIVEAQGGDPDLSVDKISVGTQTKTIKAKQDGYVTEISNKAIKTVAKFAGAPHDKGAGVLLYAKCGDKIEKNMDLFTVYAEKDYKLESALKWAEKTDPVRVKGMLLEEIPSTFISSH